MKSKVIDDTIIYGIANIFSLIIISLLVCVPICILSNIPIIVKLIISALTVFIMAFVEERYLSVVVNELVHMLLPKSYKEKEKEIAERMDKVKRRGRWL